MLTSILDRQSAVTDVDSLLSEGFLELEVEVLSDLRLGSGVLVDPQTHLVGELLIVEPGRQEGLLNHVEFNLCGPLVRLQVLFNLRSRDLLGKARVLGSRLAGLQEHL